MDENTLILRALLRQDWDAYDRFAADFRSKGKGTPVAIIGYTFHVAVRRYFGSHRDSGEVIRFVADARADLPEGRDIPVREAEALMYATLDMELPGVEETIRSLEPGKIAEIEGQLLLKLVRQENLADEQLDALLTEAEQLAAKRSTTS